MSNKYATSIAVMFSDLICTFNCLTVICGPATAISASKEAIAPTQINRPAVLSDANVCLLNRAVTEAGNDVSDATS